MSTVYKLLDFKWWDIDSILYLSDSYNNTGGFNDSSQVVGGVSGIIRYNVLNTTFSTPSRDYYWLIYFRQLPTQNNPPRSLGFRTDRWSVITAKTGSNFTITHNGTTYWVYKSAAVTYIPSRDKWEITSDNVDSNPVFVNEGTSKKNTVHDLGDKTGSTDQQIYLEGLTYLLTEPAYGQGTVTLSIKKPGQTLFFTSRLLGNTLSQYISSNATIDMNVPINIKKITQLPAQSRTDTHLDGWHGEYVAKYTVNTANVVLAIMKISTNEYTNLRFYTPYTNTKVHSSEYKLRSTGANISRSSNTPYDIEVLGFEDNRSHAEFTYVTNITLIEVQSSETVLYGTSRSGGVSDQSPLSSGDLSLASGKYVLLAGGNRYADTTHKDCWIENSNGQSLFKAVEYDPYGHNRSIVFGIVNVTGSETFKAYFRVSNSAQGDCSLSAIKLPNDSTVYSANGTGTATSTLSEVCSLSLSVGRYIVVIQTAFDTNSGCKISHQANLGSETFIEENSADTTVYKPVLNSIGYVNVISAGRVAVSVKATSSASVESKIVAVKI